MKASFWLAGSRSVVLMRSKPRSNSLPRSFDSQVPNDFFGIGFQQWKSAAIVRFESFHQSGPFDRRSSADCQH